ncbi:MAG TPA: IPTL-CTERM sorting domain-containing protein [Thermoanaerobaculia bacterium]|nr:IPTL-CTERM sorting domain-containing protein [Thermoanaerobaculia bacterium]
MGPRCFARLLVCLLVASTPVPAAATPATEPLRQFWNATYGAGTAEGLLPPSTLERTLLAKARPDECYAGLGEVPHPALQPDGTCDPAEVDGTPAVPKVNEAYVWGLALAGPRLWIGTVANTHCLVLGGFLGASLPHDNTSWACEFGTSPLAGPPFDLPDAVGDFRPPKIYSYNLLTGALEDRSPALASHPAEAALLRATLGLRSAGTHDGVVFLAGPALSAGGGINVFAYRADTGAFLGARQLAAYDDIRTWVVAGGVLYAGVGDAAGGTVLRWVGSVADPFQFQEVGQLPTEAANLAEHEGRLFVTTWPRLTGGTPQVAGLYMSAPLPPGGLVADDPWTEVFLFSDYEIDPVTAATYGGGALASFDGHLWFGTMHVPFLSTVAAVTILGAEGLDGGDDVLDPEDLLAVALGTYRPISIFRGRGFGTADEAIDLVYGLPYLPRYDPFAETYTWAPDADHEQGMVAAGWAADPLPTQGLSGFGNFFNVYTWAMAVHDGQLFTGTFDWSYLLGQLFVDLLLGEVVADLPQPISADLPPFAEALDLPIFPGADLWRVAEADAAWQPESLDGLGNIANYGVRTMVAGADLFVGSANPMNLLTDLEDPLPEGGWELLCLGECTFAAPEVVASKEARGTLRRGATALFDISVTNTGLFPVPDGEGPEVEDVLPAGLTLVGATADAGEVTLDLPANTVRWNGVLEPGQTVILTVEVVIDADAPAGLVNRAVVLADSDSDGSAETELAPEAEVVFAPVVLEVPTLGEVGFGVLVLLLAAAGLVALRRVG